MKIYIISILVCIYLSACLMSSDDSSGREATLGACKIFGLAKVGLTDTVYFTVSNGELTYSSEIALNCARKKVSFTNKVSNDTLYVYSHILDEDPDSRSLCVCVRKYEVSLEVKDSNLNFINQDSSPKSLNFKRK